MKNVLLGLFLWLAVDSVTLANQTKAVYNVEVAQAHTYFAGSGQWLVHNAEGCPLGLTAEATALLLESNAFKALSLEQRTQLVTDISTTLELKNLFNSLHDKSDDLNRCVDAWGGLKKAGSNYRLSASVLKDFSDLLKSNKFGWTLDNFDQLFTKMLKDVRLGTVVEYVDDFGETVTDVVGKTLNEEEILQTLKRLNDLNITNTAGVVKELCCESSWKFVGAEMVLRTVQKGNIWDAVSAFEKYDNGRYIDIFLTTGKRIEVKSWNKIYAGSFIKQFIEKDLAAVAKLEDLGWVFDGKYPTNLKDDILTVLKSTKGKEALDNQKIRDLFQSFGRIKLSNLTIDDTDDLIDYISNNDEWFNLIFKKQ